MDNLPDIHKRTRRLALALLSLLAVLAAWAWVRRDALREMGLELRPLESLRALEERGEADTLVHFVLARRLVEQDAAKEAAQPIASAVESLSPETPPDLIGRVFALAGYVFAKQGDFRHAQDCLERSAGLRPDDPFLLLGRGLLARRLGHSDEEIEAFAEAARLAPSRAEAWKGLGEAYLRAADPLPAVEAFRHLTALTPQDPQAHAELADALGNCRRYVEAERELQIAADLAPDNSNYSAGPAIGLAISARTEEEYLRAADAMNGVLRTRSDDPQLHATLAGLHIRFGRYPEARRELEASLARNPADSHAWHNLAIVCARAGDKTAAEAAEAHAIQIVTARLKATEQKKEALMQRNGAAP